MSVALRNRSARRGKVLRLATSEVAALLPEVPAWTLEGAQLGRSYHFAGFPALVVFVNRLAALAQAEDHHPDFAAHFDRLDVTLTTHDVAGLTENDFIVAAKLDALFEAAPSP